MKERVNNYQIQAQQAKKLFLTYDQEELIHRCNLRYDDRYLYTYLLSEQYRVCRLTGDMQRYTRGEWVDANSFAEVMTLLDWLCDSRENRYISGRWVNLVNHGVYFHRSLQEDEADRYCLLFDREPQAFAAACEALQGEGMPGADIGYAIELLDGLKILVQLWHGDEEFLPRLRFLWDENATQYIRYETTWFALGLLKERLQEKMSI